MDHPDAGRRSGDPGAGPSQIACRMLHMASNLQRDAFMSNEKQGQQGTKGEDAKHEAEKSPGRDDVHEQREPDAAPAPEPRRAGE